MDTLSSLNWNNCLRQERIRRNLRQRDVADQVGATVVTVKRWEQGRQLPSTYFRTKLCTLFEKCPEDLGFFLATRQSSTNEKVNFSAAEEISAPSPNYLHETQIQLDKDVVSKSAKAPSSSQSMQLVSQQQQNRIRLLRRLRRTYHSLLEQTLQEPAYPELELIWLQNAVQNTIHQLQPRTHQANRVLAPGTSLLTVYEETEEELLVLGEPAIGRFALLLELAQQLVQRAEDDAQPLPVIVPLSSWAEQHLPVDIWLSEQISQLYNIPHKLSAHWVHEQKFIPLLDGLDEMEEAVCLACIAAINIYHRELPGPLVVCSRITEYQVAATCTRLILQGAVSIQALSPQ